MGNKTKKLLAPLLLGVFTLGIALFSATANLYAAVTTPTTINYQGRLLSAANVPLSGNYTFRFSIWNTSDWVAGDTTGGGAVNVGSAGYAGWQETHAMTIAAGDYGLFNMNLGSVTPFPSFNATTHKNLQVEVKVTGALDTTYEILDPAGTLADVTDRKPLQNQAFAQNADTIDNADVGTAAGNLAVLGVGGVWDIARIPGGTDADTFVIDDNDSAATKILQLGSDGTDGTISFANATGDFTFATPGDDVFLFDNGSLQATADAGLNFSASDQFRIRENANPNAAAACAALGELIFNTTTNKLMYCATIGSPGVWANVDSTAGADDFETVYATDADKALTTSNANFTVNTGTGDFIVTTGVGGDLIVDGVPFADMPFSNLATRVKEAAFSPDYSGGSPFTDGTANSGTLKLSFEDLGGTGKRNYYEWTTSKVGIQDIDVVASVQLPLDFVSFTATPVNLLYKTFNAVAGTNKVDVSMYDTVGTSIALAGATSLASAAWTNAAITFGGAPTFTAGDTVTFRIKLSSTNAGFARISDLVLNYNGR